MYFHQAPAMHISKIQLKVTNLTSSLQFYQEVIGLKILYQEANRAALTADGQQVLIILEQVAESARTAMSKNGLYHFALLLPSRQDLANIVRHFTRLEIRFGAGDHLVSEALYLSDPDGNGIEIYCDRDSAGWQWHHEEVAMTTDPVDFEDLLTKEKASKWTHLPAETVMGHLHLQVGSLSESEKFYVDGIGFDIVSRLGSSALFMSDYGYHHHIACNSWHGTGLDNATETDPGLKAFTITFPTEAAREKALIRLEKQGVKLYQSNEEYIVSDPSNIAIHLAIA